VTLGLQSLAQRGFLDFLVAVVIAAGLAMLIFRHADKHDSRHATAWGLFTFLAALIAIPLYFLNYWRGKSRVASTSPITATNRGRPSPSGDP
jgi:hypothetical protein